MGTMTQEPTTADVGPAAARPPAATLYLIVHAPDGAQVLALADGDEVIAGRARDAAVRVVGTEVSRAHAAFRRRGATVEVEDLGSRNGTWLDGRKVDGRAPLIPGAAVRIGPARVGLAVCADGALRPPLPRDGDESPGTDDAPHDGTVVIADEVMRRFYREVRRVARVPCAVLITGETGAGKEVVAEYLHRASPRAGRRFVRLNCAAIPETLLESELFGHERGAFTGAERRREGWFETARGGTLFLDEIGEMAPAMQAKLLRALETGRVTRLGSADEIDVDTRIVCATHRDLPAAVAAGTFRADLYYRLGAVVLAVPPLRERPVEITLLASRFATELAGRMGVPAPAIDPEVAALLLRHGWPGNVRELRNAIERAVALGRGGRITSADLPEGIRAAGGPAPSVMRERLDGAEREAIAQALVAERGNQTHAARRLGISRRNLVYKLGKYGLR